MLGGGVNYWKSQRGRGVFRAGGAGGGGAGRVFVGNLGGGRGGLIFFFRAEIPTKEFFHCETLGVGRPFAKDTTHPERQKLTN